MKLLCGTGSQVSVIGSIKSLSDGAMSFITSIKSVSAAAMSF